MHQDFKINGNSFTDESFQNYINNLMNSKEIHEYDIAVFLKDWLNEKPYVEVQTSGSTGTPKTIQLSKQQMINSALATGTFFNTKENTKALLCLSATYIAGKMMLVRALVLGWNLHIVIPNGNPLSEIETTYDFCAMVPLQVEQSLEKLHQIKKLIIGGAPISLSLLSKIRTLKTDCFATYGMTETITHIAVKKLNNGLNSNSLSNHFQILPNVAISLDSRGCLVIEAPKVACEKIITNDVVHLISNTEFEWLGRFDHVVNSGGVKLFPEKIEDQLSDFIQSRFFVTGIPDEKLGMKLVLIIEGNGLDKALILSKIKELTSLSRFEKPRLIYFLSKFLETPTGKIKRSESINLLNK